MFVGDISGDEAADLRVPSDSEEVQSSNGTIIEPKILVTHGALTAEFIKLLRYNNTLATPALKLLDLYFCLWECYVVKSAEKMRLKNEQR
ncbi:hypothetical protein PENANT_c070G11843 [Penicillium antarcticum]|uniref:Uncharacterized protein n=1 Tax=Penicillium antarcticum TaxID=416450 RepID=A0A1V6PQE7_9EURO|nr:hypothetical protein PENANT_c070G11843 [Penicillium antarcticum]